MTELEYKELNKYLNDVFIVLSRQDGFLLNNIGEIARLNSTFLDYMDDYEIKEDYKENNLTYKDVYLIAREIIESIDKKYLKLYDGLIESGQLEFNYENSTLMGSCVRKITDNNQLIGLIDVERKFNYIDVVILIHEFFHYTNGLDKNETINRYLLTEFISIYFETYAKDYLLEKGVPKEELNVNERLASTIRHANELSSYQLLILAFNKFGNINENTINDLNKYIGVISKEDFEKDCKNTLEQFKKIENNYRSRLNNEKNYNDEELGYNYSFRATLNYRYVYGTLLALYARKYSSMKQMIYLNDTINTNTDDLLLILNEIGINLNKPSFNEELMTSLDEYVNMFNNKKEKK